MDDSLSIIEEEMEQLSVTTGETISSDLSWLDLETTTTNHCSALIDVQRNTFLTIPAQTSLNNKRLLVDTNNGWFVSFHRTK